MYLNILHRTDTGARYPVYRYQQDLVHGIGLAITLFVHYSDLFDDKVLEQVRQDAATHGDEIGLALHNLKGPGLNTGGANQIWLLPLDRKREVLQTIFSKYREVFGEDPVSVASYHLDASCMQLIREISPGTEGVVGGCFEEGVRVFHGCNNSWYLFNEGMPWGPWYPSKTHSLRPAADAEDAVGLVALPHLVRDMSLSYEGRNDFWATHPPNVIRGMGNEATWSPYDLNLVDQYRMQERWNEGHSYINTFVSAPWLTWNHNSEYPPEVACTLYENQLRYFRKLKDEGQLDSLTMRDYVRKFRDLKQPGQSEVFWAKELLYGSGKHYLWHIERNMRVLIDANQGGSIGDLRPYAGKVALNTGPESPQKAIGSYPYLIQSQHRTGYANHCHDGSRTTLLIQCGDQTIDLCAFPARCRNLIRNGEETVVELEPVSVPLEGQPGMSIQTTYRFPGDSAIHISRDIRFADGQTPSQLVTVTEYVKGCWGFTEYPEDLSKVRLSAKGEEAQTEFVYTYRGRAESIDNPSVARACIPDVNTKMTLEPETGKEPRPIRGSVSDGHLFNPYYTLTLTWSVQTDTTLYSCLSLNPIKS